MSTMNSKWMKTWPECVHDFQGFAQLETIPGIHENIVALANYVGFKDVVEADRVEDSLHSHRDDLSNEELMQSTTK